MNAARKIKKTGSGELFLCGVGLDFMNDITLETVSVLRSCDVAFYDQNDRQRLAKALKIVAPGLPITFIGGQTTDLRVSFDMLLAELEKGRRVAYITYGHPLLFGEGADLADKCLRHGCGFKVVSAVSAIDRLLGVFAERGELLLNSGFSVCYAEDLLDPSRQPHLCSPVIIFCACEALKKHGEKLWLSIERNYPADHPVYLVRLADCIGKTLFRATSVKELRASAGLIEHRASMILPAVIPDRPAERKLRRHKGGERRGNRN